MSKRSDNDFDELYIAGLQRLWPDARVRLGHDIDLVLRYLDVTSGERSTADEAANAAHKIAGTVGIFGLPAASSSASMIEQWIEAGERGDVVEVEAMALEIRRQIDGHDIDSCDLAPRS